MKNKTDLFEFNPGILFTFGFWAKFLVVIITFVALNLLMLFQDYNSVTRIKISDVISKDIVVDDDMNYIDEKASARNEEILTLSNVPCYFFDEQYSQERLNAMEQLLSALRANVQFNVLQEIATENKMNFSENEFKVLSKMNIAEHRRPQDGTFSKKYKNGSYDFRINTLPVAGKEKVCIRVLAPAVSLNADDKNIKLAGGTDEDVARIKNMVSCPNGIILTSGPTGSGKTTTLYSVLKSLNDEDVNITTIEDPIEIKLEGINQSQINAKAGITFASCMRAILRQDPDIILVGEIRDYETLEIAISAALTGHLVLSTVHTNSAAATVTRMIEMGAKDYLVSSTLSGVIAQRLVRKLCDDCKEEYYPSHDEAAQILATEEEVQEMMKTPIYRAKGCGKCEFSGYKGRLGVYEIMQMNKEIKKLIAQGAHDLEIEEAAVRNGMKTLNQSCMGHIKNGWTTIEEFVRVLGVVNE